MVLHGFVFVVVQSTQNKSVGICNNKRTLDEGQGHELRQESCCYNPKQEETTCAGKEGERGRRITTTKQKAGQKHEVSNIDVRV